jgi:DNA invertase Pin-like site-specific DNA recombinase
MDGALGVSLQFALITAQGRVRAPLIRFPREQIVKRVAVYVRVSTTSKSKQGEAVNFVQNLEVQEEPLKELIAQRGWTLHRVYSDRASGAKERRPGLDALMADARRGLFDVVIVWRFDRFARSVKQLVLGLEEFRALGIDFVSHQEALDSSTPLGKAMFTIIGAMAELEPKRDQIWEIRG